MPDLLIKKIQYTILVFSIVGISETQSLGAYRSLSIRCIAILIEHDDIIYGMTAV
jgi:hypothetical protein